ncbi:hypothetical protein ACIHCV_22105 [Streptomyces sp. NPDC051956]|uniref:hypothetical protein n=1 Tax=Streptomyces sp. NPDC051956 TaxID=3365677 RepID=UPI0037D78651
MIEALRSPRRPLVLGAVLTVALAAQSALLVAQQMQIDDLRMEPVDLQASVKPGPSGPSGPPGPTGPVGPIGPAGKDGTDGKDGKEGTNGKDGTSGKDGKDAVVPPAPDPS